METKHVLNQAFGREIDSIREQILATQANIRVGYTSEVGGKAIIRDLERTIQITEKAWTLANEALENSKSTFFVPAEENEIVADDLTIVPESRRIVAIIGRAGETSGHIARESIPINRVAQWFDTFLRCQADQHADGIQNAIEILAVHDGYKTILGEEQIYFYFTQFGGEQ